MASLCEFRHGTAALKPLWSSGMEWMLQVVDEVDDAIFAMMHRWMGLRLELGALIEPYPSACDAPEPNRTLTEQSST